MDRPEAGDSGEEYRISDAYELPEDDPARAAELLIERFADGVRPSPDAARLGRDERKTINRG